jgi:predicted nucleic acid-binding protein
LDADDADHAASVELFAASSGPWLTTQTVVAETAYFVGTRLGAEVEARWLADLAAGVILPVAIEPGDWLRIAELAWQYRDLPLGTVDASLVAIAERLNISKIATLDRRDFSAVRPVHVEAFELLP